MKNQKHVNGMHEYRIKIISEILSLQDKLYSKHFDNDLFDGNGIIELREIRDSLQCELEDSILFKEGAKLNTFKIGNIWTYGTIIKCGYTNLLSKYPVKLNEYGINLVGEHIIVLYDKIEKKSVTFLYIGETFTGNNNDRWFTCIYTSFR